MISIPSNPLKILKGRDGGVVNEHISSLWTISGRQLIVIVIVMREWCVIVKAVTFCRLYTTQSLPRVPHPPHTPALPSDPEWHRCLCRLTPSVHLRGYSNMWEFTHAHSSQAKPQTLRYNKMKRMTFSLRRTMFSGLTVDCDVDGLCVGVNVVDSRTLVRPCFLPGDCRDFQVLIVWCDVS